MPKKQVLTGVFLIFDGWMIHLMDYWLHFREEDGRHYNSLVLQKNAFMVCDFISMGIIRKYLFTARKVSKYGVFLVRIFLYLDWMQENTDRNNSLFGHLSRRFCYLMFFWPTINHTTNKDLQKLIAFCF